MGDIPYDAIAMTRSGQSVSVPGSQPVRRFFNKIKQYRRMATRYEQLAANHLAFIQR